MASRQCKSATAGGRPSQDTGKMTSRQCKSATAGGRTLHGKPDRYDCGITIELGSDTIKQWLKANPDCELERAEAEPIYYSTELKDGKLRCSQTTANKKILKKDYITCARGRDLLDPTIKHPPQYLNLELECLLKRHKTDERKFVCQGAVLKEVGLTPHCKKNQYDARVEITVKQTDKTIYMFKYRFDSKSKTLTDWERKNIHAGLVFEHYLTQDIVSTPNQKSYASVEAEFGGHKLIISGEIDCVDENDDFVELKTSKHEIKDVHFLERTKWWLQCYLLGVKTIVVGKHDDDHQCTDVIELPVSSDASAVPQNLKDWVDRAPPTTSHICLGAIHKFLTEVEKFMQEKVKTITRETKIYSFIREKNLTHFTVKQIADSHLSTKFSVPVPRVK